MKNIGAVRQLRAELIQDIEDLTWNKVFLERMTLNIEGTRPAQNCRIFNILLETDWSSLTY